jgi:LuxR family maltose regulon positive regulatory protein
MDTSTLLENQLLATKFFAPGAPGTPISRPRLTALLDESLQYPLTLISAPAGFGKTTLLATWGQALPANNPRLCWVSLDEEDNDPRLFWTYVLSALNRQQPQRFTPLLTQLQSPHAPPLKYLLTMLINLLAESTDHFLLILDDYQVITEQQVHSTLSYLVEHLPTQLRLILSTRADPALSLPQMRAHGHILEVRTDQLRCTVEETAVFFKQMMGIQLPDETIQQVTARTEGWLVGLQLLGLSLPEHADPLSLLEQVSGDQRYILDYLTEEVLRRQPQEVQTFLLSTCILERLTASLCDAVMQQTGSQQMLQRLERANLFVVSLDSRRQWYRYHALFAEALRYRLEQTHHHQVPILHSRASLWYAQHDQTTEAIMHALHAKEWQWTADLIQQKLLPLMSLTWGAGKHILVTIKQWLEQLPVDVMHSRPQLCLASALLLFQVAPYPMLESWLDVAEATLTAVLSPQTDEDGPSTMIIQENLLGTVIALRAALKAFEGDEQATLELSQRALTLLSPENLVARAGIASNQGIVLYVSSANNAVTAVETMVQTISLARAADQIGFILVTIGSTALHMLGTGQLHEAYQQTQQAIELDKQSEKLMIPEVGLSAAFQAMILCEWNKLDEAFALAQEAISLSQQGESFSSLTYIAQGYATLLHIALSRGDLEVARTAFQEFERIGLQINQPLYLSIRSYFITVDQVRLWLACGELDQATRWAEELDILEQHITPFAREREEVACVRVLLAKDQPALALERLESVLQRATIGQRWGHVIEIRLLQALAHQICHEETQALDTLSEAVHLAEPEGYIRSFVDEGASMEALLYQLRKQERKHGPTPYLDTVIAAFQQESMAHGQAGEPTKAQPLPKSLSGRELEVLQLLAHGASNLEIAQELVIALDTVKRHVRQILSKLGVKDRFQAVKHARELDLLDEMQGT